MKNRQSISSFLLLLLMGCLSVRAQIPAATLFQAPLLIHPGLAGNSGKNRIALLANQSDYYVPVTKEPSSVRYINERLSYRSVFDRSKNFYASYDGLAGSLGIGAFATYYTTPSTSNTNAEHLKKYGEYGSQGYSLGCIISPKLSSKENEEAPEPDFTLSPSLLVSYKSGKERSDMFIPETGFGYEAMRGTLFSKHIRTRQLSGEVGMVANTKRGYLGYNAGFIYDFSTEAVKAYREFIYKEYDLKMSTLAMHHSVCLGLVFPKREGSLLSFSPVSIAGFSHHLSGNRSTESIHRSYLETGSNWFGYLHQSFNFRLKWLLFGGSYSEFKNQRTLAYHIGFKSSFMRFTMFYARVQESPRMEGALTILF